MTDILNTYQIIKSQDQLIVKMVQDVLAWVNDEIYTRSRLLAIFFSFPGSNQIACPWAWQQSNNPLPRKDKLVKCPTKKEWKLVKSLPLAHSPSSRALH